MQRKNINDSMENNQLHQNLESVFNDNSPENNKLYDYILSICNERLRQQGANLISKHLEKLALQGYHTGAIAPFGYSVIPVYDDSLGHTIIRKKLIAHPAESITVKTLFKIASKLITQGKFSYTIIAQMLNEKGLHRRKSIWNYKNVKSTLTNTRYCGVTVYGVNRSEFNAYKKTLEIDCLAIISKPIFEKVNQFITELRT